ncbi:cupin domain-containing protein [Aquimarina rubra]|uniref:Cupin domain-containing protein n=1 Tax=Aquimarina rubra TaxID=1920033 RepID=A0ABW5LI45_9FLAO
MKKVVNILLLTFPIIIISQNSQYNISSYLDEGSKAPNTHYIGEAWLNPLFRADDDLGYHITKATFRANSTLDWHKHSSPQVLIIIEGKGYYQERGKEPIILNVGDVIKCNKSTEHWHSSSKDSQVTYLALYAGDKPTIWTEVLTQEYYNNVAEKLKK